MSAVLSVRISEIEKAAIERAAAVSGRSQSSLAAAAIGRYMRKLAWLEEKVAKARASRDLSATEVNAMLSALERVTIIWTAAACADLRAIRAWLDERNQAAAGRVIREIRETVSHAGPDRAIQWHRGTCHPASSGAHGAPY